MVSLFLAAAAAPVTTATLLSEMADPARLALGGPAPYKTVQASSFDRRAKTPGTEDWFANGDAGQYLREEVTEGRKERVLADWKGPGALVRLWSANATGRIRFYFDGEDQPRLAARTDLLLSGQEPGFPSPLAEKPQRGWNFYYPLPFSRSLKITVSDERENDQTGGMYYLASCRQYSAGTPVESWRSDVAPLREALKAVRALRNPAQPRGESKTAEAALAPGQALRLRFSADAPRAITAWRVSWSPTDPSFKIIPEAPTADDRRRLHPLSQALARVEARLTFDGVQTASLPLGHFFGSPDLVFGRLKTLLSEVKPGEATSRLVMPFGTTAQLEVINHSSLTFRIKSQAWVGPGSPTAPFLRARWTAHQGGSRPLRDMTFLEGPRQGRYVGTVLEVQNPSSQWWGEGDEKVSVDGESFPSWFGTGTEDYFGYAWCDPQRFDSPYQAQPHSLPPTNTGRTGNVRWHVMDDIPFTRGIRFQMEMWHWAVTESRFASTSFWYGPREEGSEPSMDPALAVVLPLFEEPGVEGALEGEKLKASRTSGLLQIQTGFNDLSRGRQLWWTEMPTGGRLTLEVPVQKRGPNRIKGSFCHAKDYGIHEIFVNGKSAGVFDFYGEGVSWKVLDLGVHDLRGKTALIEAVCVGKNPKALPGHMFGLDYLLVENP